MMVTYLQFRAPGAPDHPLLPRPARARAQASQDTGGDHRLVNSELKIWKTFPQHLSSSNQAI